MVHASGANCSSKLGAFIFRMFDTPHCCSGGTARGPLIASLDLELISCISTFYGIISAFLNDLFSLYVFFFQWRIREYQSGIMEPTTMDDSLVDFRFLLWWRCCVTRPNKNFFNNSSIESGSPQQQFQGGERNPPEIRKSLNIGAFFHS